MVPAATGTPTKALEHFGPESDWTLTTAEIEPGVPAPQDFALKTTR